MSAQVGAIEQVVQAVKSGELSQKAINASVERVSLILELGWNNFQSPYPKALGEFLLAILRVARTDHSRFTTKKHTDIQFLVLGQTPQNQVCHSKSSDIFGETTTNYLA
jgi:hypothetical protein